MMTKKENENNNLFKWATKELSQDAVLAWLLSKKNSDIGKDLIKSMCKSVKDDDFEIENVFTQIQSIDILVDLKIGDEYVAVIIEDKTDTFLHNHQMLKSIEKVSQGKIEGKKYNKIIYVLFKTGTIYEFEEEEYNQWKKEINEEKKRKFNMSQLNDRIKNPKDISQEGLIISGSYQNCEINIDESPEIFIESIYSLDCFQNIIGGIEYNEEDTDSIKTNLCNYYLKNKDKNDNNTSEDTYTNGYAEAEKFNGNGIYLRMIRPGGGGKRNYEFCFHSEEFYSYGKEAENIEKISDNFLILPYIRKKDKGYCYAINYNLIGDINKLHGYIPYNQLPKNAKEKLQNFKKEVKNIATGIINSEGISSTVYLNDSIKDNRLQVLSFNSETIDENKINLLLKLAKKLSNGIKNS